MHLFIIHQFPDLDTFAPVIYKLDSKVKGMANILSVYPVQDFRKYGLVKFLLKRKIKYYSLSDINLKSRFLILLLKILFLLPKFILTKLNILWHPLYHYVNLFTSNDICRFIEKEKIKSITIDNALPLRFQKIFYNSCLRMNIKLIKCKVGINVRKNVKIEKSELECCNKYILSENLIPDPEDINLKKKIVRIDSARFSLEWLDILEEINHLKLESYKPYSPGKDKLKIVIFSRPHIILGEWKKIEEKIKSLDNVEVKLKIKPRGDLSPLHSGRHFVIQSTSSELINWADLIVSHISSVLIEAFIKKKTLFFLDYITKDKHKTAAWYYYKMESKKESYHLDDYSFFVKINSLDHLIREITLFSKNIQNLRENKLKDQKNFLKNILGNQYDNKGLLDKYANFYINL
jgi:hypothetical protein